MALGTLSFHGAVCHSRLVMRMPPAFDTNSKNTLAANSQKTTCAVRLSVSKPQQAAYPAPVSSTAAVTTAVSYIHLDVYKRQTYTSALCWNTAANKPEN